MHSTGVGDELGFLWRDVSYKCLFNVLDQESVDIFDSEMRCKIMAWVGFEHALSQVMSTINSSFDLYAI